MLPQKGGIREIESIPDCRTSSKYEPSDILISNIRPYFCKIWFATREGACSNDILVIKANEETYPKFLYYVLSDQNFFNYDMVTSKGTKMPRGNKNAIMKYLVPDVDFHIQQKIAGILSSYDALIENNTKRIKLLEQMAENLYKEWFVRFRFPGHEQTEFVNGLPSGWKIQRFGELFPILTGKKDANFASPNGIYKFFTCSKEDLSSNSFSFDCFAIILAGNGDLNVKLYEGKFEAYQRTYVLSPYNIEHIYISYYTILSELDRLLAGAAGAVIKFLTKGMIENIKVLLPDNKSIQRFNYYLSNNYQLRQRLINQNELLAKQRDLLLPRLMSGKLEVKP